MEISTGHIHLFDIYSYAARNAKLVSGINGDMREYTKLINQIVEPIPDDRAGWYLWGRYNDIGWWETIYLGKAGNKKTSSLRARIREELLDERAAFWATLYGSERIEQQFQKIYKNKYGPGTRTYRKCNTHFIVWASIAPVTEEEILTEESVLIALYRPAINIKRVSYPPHTPNTERILRVIDIEIAKIINQN